MSNKFKFLSLILLLSISTLSYSNRRENNGIIDTTPGGGGFGGGRDTDKYWYCGDTYVPRIGGISKSEACSANFNLRLDSSVDNKPIKPIYGNVENKPKYKVSIIPEDDTIFVRKIISEEDSTIISPRDVDLKPTRHNTTGRITVTVDNRYEDRDISPNIHKIPAPELGETQFLISAKRYEIHGSDLIGVEIDEDESSERKLVYKLNDKKLKSELEGKLNKDLSNLLDNTILESKLSEGVRDKLNSKLDKNLSNLTDHVIVKEKLSTEVIKEIEGKLDKDLSNINDKEKENLRKNLDVYNKGEVDTKLDGKLNKDLSNLSDNSILESKLSEGVRYKLNNKVDKDGNNINIEKFIEKLNENSNISIPTGSLVKDSDVKNYLENNYTNNIELKKQLDKKLEKDLSNLNDKEKEALRKNLDVYNKGEVDSKLEGKLNKDLSNLSDNSILESKLSEGVRDKLNSKLDKNLSNLTDHVIVKEKLSTEVIKEIEGKLNKDLSNINDKEKESLRKNLDVYNKGEVDSKLEGKLNKDLSNLSDNSILESKLSEGVRDKLNSKLDKNLSNLTDHVIVKEKLSTEVIKEIEGKLNKDLSNINDKEKENLRKNLDVYNKGEVDTKLDGKLNKDLSNLSDNSILESKLSEGVRYKLNNKVDKDGNNINIEKFIEKLNENSNISIPTGSLVKDSDVKNYLENNYTNNIELKKQLDKKLEKDLSNLNDKEKEALRKNLDVYNKGEVDSKLEGKLNKDLSNLSDNSILESKLSEGVRDKLNSKLDKNLSNLTDHVIVKEKLSTEVIKEIEGKLNKDLSNINDKEKESLRKNLDVYNKGEIDSKLEGKLNKDLSNLSDNSILESKLSEGVRDKLNSKLDKNLSNLTDHVIVKEKLSTEVIKEIEGKLNKDLSNINDKEKENLRKNLDVYNKGEVDSKLETKLNKDLSNLSDNSILESKLSEGVRDKLNNKVDKDGNNINIEKFIEKLNENSNISSPTGKLVKDSNVKNYLENNYTNNIELKKQLDKKLEKDLSNINDNEKQNLRKNLDLYSKKEINDSLAVKANKDGSNIEVDKYISILSNGSNLQNPKNMLVTDKMLKEYISKNQGIVYDNVDKTELSLYNTTIHNVSDGINPTDAVNKRQLDSVASGVAVAIANSNLSTQKGHSIGIGVGYFKKEWGISLGYSGEINRFGFKVNSGLSSKLEFSAGLGLSYSFGKKEEPFVMKADDNNLDIFVDRINNIEKNVKEKLEKYINEDRKGMERDIEKLKSENLNLKKEISKIYEILKDKKEVVSDVVVVDKFEFDKTDISKDNMKKIDEFLGKRKISILNIIGHTDKVGTEQYNIDLSLRRAKSVKEYIKNKMLYGVINIFGKGEKEPISSKDEENRRVELIVEEE